MGVFAGAMLVAHQAVVQSVPAKPALNFRSQRYRFQISTTSASHSSPVARPRRASTSSFLSTNDATTSYHPCSGAVGTAAQTRALTHGAVVGSPTSRYFSTTESASFAASSASGASSPWSSSSATNAAHRAANLFTRIHSHPPRRYPSRESIPSLLSPRAAPALTSAFTASDQSMQFRKRAYDQQTDFSPNVWSGRGASSVSLRQPRAFLGIFSPVVAAIVAAFAAVFVVGAALKAVVAITFAMVAVSVILPIAFFVLLFSLPLFIPAIQLGIAAAVGTAGAAFALIATILGAAWSFGLLNRGSSSRSSDKAGRGGRRGKRGKRSSDFESEMMDYLDLSPKEREKMKKALNKLGVRRWFNGASSEDNEWKKWVDYIECSEDEEDRADGRRVRERRDAGGETESFFMSSDNKRGGSKKGSGSGTGVWLEEEERKRMKKFDEKLIEKSVRKMGDPSSWSVDQVASWLELQGFGAYADTFKEQRVCGGVLLNLTTSELRDDLSVKSLGERKLMLESILELKKIGDSASR